MEALSSTPYALGRANIRPALVLTILCSSVFMAALDMFIVNIALDEIGRDVGQVSLSDLSWVLNGYTIFYGALLVPAGRLVDRYGRKAGFLAGLALFTLTSLGCALSSNLTWLVIFRCLQAAGAAVLTPASLGLVLTTMPPEQRARSVRIWASTSSLAGAAGPVIGGLLVDTSWRWIFVLNLPIGVAAAIAALRFLPNPRPEASSRMPDLIGGALLIVAIGSLALGLEKAHDWGWTSSTTLLCSAVVVVGLVAFLVRSARHPAPVLDLSLLRHRVFAWSNIAAFLMSVAFGAELLSVILFLQQRWQWSALKTGLAIAPGPCMVPIFAIVSSRLSKRFSAGSVAALGTMMLAAGPLLLLVSAGENPTYAASLLPGWLLIGVGMGLSLPTIFASATSELPRDQTATGSAVVNMARQMGFVIGTSAFVVILGSSAASSDPDRAFWNVWWFSAATALVAAMASLGIGRQESGAAEAPGAVEAP